MIGKLLPVVAFGIVLSGLSCASKPFRHQDYQDYELVEFCLFEKVSWKNDRNHICQFIVHQNDPQYKDLNVLLPDISKMSRIMQVRPVYTKYHSVKSQDEDIMRDCYKTIGVFKRCVNKVQNKLEVIGFTERSRDRLQTLWDNFKDADAYLVAHCFRSHQTDTYVGCEGITHDVDVHNPSERHEHLLDSWQKEEIARDQHIAELEAKGDTIMAQVTRCLYDQSWKKQKKNPLDRTHICYYVTGMRRLFFYVSRREKQTMESMMKQYRRQKLSDKVSDCYHHHRYDFNAYPGCSKISWDFDEENGVSGFYIPKDPELRKLWLEVAKSANDEHVWREHFDSS